MTRVGDYADRTCVRVPGKPSITTTASKSVDPGPVFVSIEITVSTLGREVLRIDRMAAIA